jgi:hypothetical protein
MQLLRSLFFARSVSHALLQLQSSAGTLSSLQTLFADGLHRRNMVKAACSGSDWLRAASWEVGRHVRAAGTRHAPQVQQESFEDFPSVTAQLYRQLRRDGVQPEA